MHSRSLRSLIGLITVSGLAMACSDQSTPVGNEFELPVVSFFDVAPGPGRDVLRRTVPLPHDMSDTREIENDKGGCLEVDQAGIEVCIPKGALPGGNNAEIEITLTALAGDKVAFVFSPHIEFTKPVEIEIDVEDTEAEYLMYNGTPDGLLAGFVGVYYTGDGAVGGVTTEETFPVYFDEDELEFETDHFSGYAMAF